MSNALVLLRSLVFLLWMVVTVIPYAIAVLVASTVQRGAPLYWMCVAWLRLVIGGARWICGVRYRVQGMEHVPSAARERAAVILAPKHQSTWETFALPTLMPHPLAYVFKKELLQIPFFGWAMGRLDMIHIDRSKRAEAWGRVAEQGARLMAEGVWVIMFPEGTRTPRGSQGVYKNGATRLAVASGTPIVPIAVASARCWPRRSFLLRPGTIDVSIGQPIDSRGREADELMREIERWIEAEMRRLDPEAYPPVSESSAAAQPS
ncbi:MAG TPA: lysophospholipid acyltransferase family protein [Burkholderiaceae bacterium]|nr:lysophospholipid acyltransferase family protein [Burkholderiaceae bacterium]